MKALLVVCAVSAACCLPVAELRADTVKTCADHSAKTLHSKARPYLAIITEAAKQHQVRPALIKAVITAESCFKNKAVSPKQAAGLMQLMPDTATRFGAQDVFDPEENIHAGARYLKFLLKRYKGSVIHAVAAYNAGEGRIPRNRPVHISFRETRTYIHRVLTAYGKLENSKTKREQAGELLADWQQAEEQFRANMASGAGKPAGNKTGVALKQASNKTETAKLEKAVFVRQASIVPAAEKSLQTEDVANQSKLAACQDIPESVLRLTRQQGNGRYRAFIYPARAGESLHRAADKLGVSVETIAGLNAIKDGGLPVPGYPLRVAECALE